jgi:hypothetical protein
LTEGLEVTTFPPFVVADAGSLGGGILSCLGGCGGYSEPLSFAAWDRLMLLFELLLFQPKLSLRRRDVPDEGVDGSSGLDGVGGSSFLGVFVVLGARGPVKRWFLCSGPVSNAEISPLVLDLGIRLYSPVFFGSDEDKKGDTACLETRFVCAIGMAALAPYRFEGGDSEQR